jgi:integrase
MRLGELNAFVLQKLVNNLSTEKSLSSVSVRLALSVIHNALEYAEGCSYITVNPCRRVRRQRLRQKETAVFTRDEQVRIELCIDLSNNKRHLGVLISRYAGLRLGEVCALTWADVQTGECKLTVNASIKRTKESGDKMTLSPLCPKTSQSKRTVPIPQFLEEKLIQAKITSQSKYVISTKKGNFVNPRTLQQLYRKRLARAGVEYKNLHACQHTYATRAIELGVDVKTVSSCLGHINSMITLNRYVHSLEENKRRVISLFDAFFVSQSRNST